MEGIFSELCARSGACGAGFAAWAQFAPHMTAAQREQAAAMLPGQTGLLCAAFPYFSGNTAGNLSLYARGADYHRAVKLRLERGAEWLRAQYPGYHFLPTADVSPFPEVWAAACAGVGKLGRNGLLMTEAYGSFVFLGTLATDLPLSPGKGVEGCRDCGACRRACPGGALTAAGGITESRCLSAITQQRGTLSPEQAALAAAHPLIWGCDFCQLVCPENREILQTALPEFREQLRCSLSEGELAQSDRAFRRAFAGSAFTWRGVQPLRRNLTLQKEKQR